MEPVFLKPVFLNSLKFILREFRLNANDFKLEVRTYIPQFNSDILGRITNDS
jgi:hypothetical protein